MIKKDDIVYHKGLLKRSEVNNAAEFKVVDIKNERAEVELVVPADEPFDVIGNVWRGIPLENLIKVTDYNESGLDE